MTAITNLFLTSGALLQLQASGTKADSGDRDGFAAMFRRASDTSRASPESIHGATLRPTRGKPVAIFEKQSFTEPTGNDAPEDIPDELAALVAAAIPPVIHEQVTDPAAGQNPDAISITDTTNVVSSLESNKEIEAPADNAAATGQEFTLPTGVAAQEQTARMPQTSGQTKLPEEDVKTDSGAADNASVLCPLENENNKAEKNSDAPAKREGEQEKPRDTRVFGQSQTVDISPERFVATEQLSRTVEAAPQTATVDTLYNTLVESVFTASTSESKFMEIQLKPEFLGKVAVQLTLGDAGLEIKIKAEDAGVKGLIADQITQLTSSLNDKGVKISAVEVVFANVTDHSYDGSSSHHQDTPQPKNVHSRNVNIGFGVGFTEEADSVSVVDAGLSSVEYRV